MDNEIVIYEASPAMKLQVKETGRTLGVTAWATTKSAQSARITEGGNWEVGMSERPIFQPFPCRCSFRVIPWSPSSESETTAPVKSDNVFNLFLMSDDLPQG